jgi:hypothetical protein
MHFMTLGAVSAYYLPITFLCSTILFATFVEMCNTQILITDTYVQTHFVFHAH